MEKAVSQKSDFAFIPHPIGIDSRNMIFDDYRSSKLSKDNMCHRDA